MPNPIDDARVLRQSGKDTELVLNPTVVALSQYAVSLWVAYSHDYNGDDYIFHWSTHTSATGDSGFTTRGDLEPVDSNVVGGMVWKKYRYVLQIEDCTSLAWNVNYSPNNTAGYRYITDVSFVKMGSYCHAVSASSQPTLCGTEDQDEDGSSASSYYSMVRIDNPVGTPFVFQQSGSAAELQLNPVIEPNTSYVLSLWVGYSSDYCGDAYHMHWEYWRSNGDVVKESAVAAGTVTKTVETVGGITWHEYRREIDVQDTNGAFFSWHVGAAPHNTAGYRYITGLSFSVLPEYCKAISTASQGTLCSAASGSDSGSFINVKIAAERKHTYLELIRIEF